MRLLAAIILCFLPVAACAKCEGQDLRNLFSPDTLQELDQASADIQFGQGNHWLARKGNRKVHIIGTMHVNDPRMLAPLQRLRPIIESADLLLLESTAAEEAQLQRAVKEKPELLLMEGGGSLTDVLAADQLEVLAQASDKLGLPLNMTANLKPWYLSLLMSVPSCALLQSAKGKLGFGKMIAEVAHADRVPMRALDPYDTVFNLFQGQPIEEQVALLNISVLGGDADENRLFSLKESYFREDPAEIWETRRQLAYQEFDLPRAEIDAILAKYRERLLDHRNLNWAPLIDEAPEDNIVVAVGVAHLMGDTGVLNLLKERGYELTRQPF